MALSKTTVLIVVLIGLLPVQWSTAQVSYNREIRPILSRHCTVCHGPDESSRQADLRIDQFESATADLGGYSALVPGEPDISQIIIRVTADDSERMPPEDHGPRLNQQEIALLKKWIEEGAKFETHWSFVKPTKPEPPETSIQNWTHNEIDHFVLAAQEQIGLAPSKPAGSRRLIRRLSLDLIGLPPSREMVEQFAGDSSLENYENIVDRLLADNAFGEHWASMWLDLARYADTTGYAGDEPRTIWPWRDWVIDAFNDNMPFDQFTTDQLAGDLLPDATERQRLATAFHRNTLSNNEGGTNDELFRTIAVKDRVNTTLNVWMGLTVRCAECHSHKYDPISQTEYYQLLDFFNQTEDADRPDERPTLDTFPKGREAELGRIEEQIRAQNAKLARLEATSDESPAEDRQKAADAIEAQIEKLTKRKNKPVAVPTMTERPTGKRRKTHVMKRGNFQNLGAQVPARVPAAFHPLSAGAPKNRLGISQWLVDEDNPLTARVTVNRFWARLFGRGIVETEEDFGTQGSLPTHPELLDWLAVDFQQNGWDVKRLLKQIVMSKTYRQSSRATSRKLAMDPNNLYLARGARTRLPAEVLRDQALFVSGLLSRKMYGPPVYPPNPIKQVANAFKGATKWNTSTGQDRYRRALYTYLKRSQPHPLFDTFDLSTRDVCSLRRISTNTPLQSFMTLNDEAFVEAAQALAARMHEKSTVNRQIAYGLERALIRPADPGQVDTLEKLYQYCKTKYDGNPDAARTFAGAIAEGKPASKTAELASLTVVANVILNLDAFLTK